MMKINGSNQINIANSGKVNIFIVYCFDKPWLYKPYIIKL